MEVRKAYTFDDVLLVPKKSSISSRKDIDLSVDLGKGVKLTIPIVSANMKTVTGPEMAAEISELGGLGLLHRFSENRFKDFMEAKDLACLPNIGISVGVKDDEKDFLDKLYEKEMYAHHEIAYDSFPRIICIDVAHGHHDNCLNMVNYISTNYPETLLIAGNIATSIGALDLASAGADVIRVGIGNGSLCTTRLKTGNGVPQLTALSDVYSALKSNGYNTKIIADGSIKKAGDIVKALCFSHAVMIGNLFAGTPESPGEFESIDVNNTGVSTLGKFYAGSSTHKDSNIEGIKGFVPAKENVLNIVEKLLDGIRSGCSYQNAFNLEELKVNPRFVEITNSGMNESKAHAKMITGENSV